MLIFVKKKKGKNERKVYSCKKTTKRKTLKKYYNLIMFAKKFSSFSDGGHSINGVLLLLLLYASVCLYRFIFI